MAALVSAYLSDRRHEYTKCVTVDDKIYGALIILLISMICLWCDLIIVIYFPLLYGGVPETNVRKQLPIIVPFVIFYRILLY